MALSSFSPEEQWDGHIDRRAAGRPNDPKPFPHDPGPVDHVVRDAEEIVGEAWVEMLFWHRDRACAAAQTASEHCEDVRRRLSAMLLERAPTGVSAVQADLDAALAAARQAVRIYEQASQALVLQLEFHERRATQRRDDAAITRDGEAAPQVQTELPGEAAQPRPAPARTARRFPLWLLRLLTKLAGHRRSP